MSILNQSFCNCSEINVLSLVHVCSLGFGKYNHLAQFAQFSEAATTNILQNRCSWKFFKFHKKTPVFEPLFNKIAGLESCNFIKKRLQRRCFPVKLWNFWWLLLNNDQFLSTHIDLPQFPFLKWYSLKYALHRFFDIILS